MVLILIARRHIVIDPLEHHCLTGWSYFAGGGAIGGYSRQRRARVASRKDNHSRGILIWCP
jgi:hypothetical protein